jgi:hypothetical protein
MFHSRLPALTEEQTAAYIARRLAVAGCADTFAFPQEVVQRIYAIAQGIPRVVNLLCENALICAYGEQCRVISPEMIQRIAMDFDLSNKYLATTGNGAEVAEAKPTAVDEREAVPVLARVAVAAASAAPPVRAVPVAAAIPIPVTPVAVPFTRVAPGGATPETPARPRKYWRRHRTRSAVAEFARRSVSTVKQAWQAIWGMLVEWVGRVRGTLFPMVEKRPPVNVAKEPSKEEWWTAIEFDVLERMHPSAAQKQALYARNSMSSVKGMWSAVSGPVAVYFRSVVDSFVRDCRMMRRDSPAPTPVPEVSASVDSGNGKPRSTAHRCTLALVQWLRQPMSLPRASVNGSNGKRRSTTHRCTLALVQWLREPMSLPRASSRPRRLYVSASGDHETAETEN